MTPGTADGSCWGSATPEGPDRSGGLYLTADGGASWRPFLALPFANIQRVVADPADLSRLYVTTFGGSVWHGPALPAPE